MIRVGILGGTGYTGYELMRILLRHPDAAITVLTTRQGDRPHVGDVHRQLRGLLDLHFENFSVDEVAELADCIFCCLPHGASAEFVKEFLARDKIVIDLSADYRLNDAASYEKWYGEKHPDPERMGNVVYGLPELFRSKIKESNVVANPGCFPTTAILALAPFVNNDLIKLSDIIVDSKTGISGGGRTPKINFHYPECNESISAYNVGKHRHMPEIDQILTRAFSKQVEVIFTPHLTPMDRGILSTIYATPTQAIDEKGAMRVLREFYANEPFVRVVEHLPATKDVTNSNFCDITARVVRGRLVLLSAIDNLIKGASGAAVQNMNVIFDLPETTALTTL